jgi:ATP-binding cassette, subfamily B, heavy metal transporter
VPVGMARSACRLCRGSSGSSTLSPLQIPMRRASSSEPSPISTQPRNDWQTILSLLPYLATYKWRVGFALSCLIGAKVANLGVSIVMKRIVDSI